MNYLLGYVSFCTRSVNFPVVFCCHTKVYITYRGSTYEQSWDTRFITSGARALRSDPQWVCQSTTATPRRTAAGSRAYLPNQ
jgi:hypothetical protein